MIVAKRIKKAFAYDSSGKLAPIGENIFIFPGEAKKKNAASRRKAKARIAKARIKADSIKTVRYSA